MYIGSLLIFAAMKNIGVFILLLVGFVLCKQVNAQIVRDKAFSFLDYYAAHEIKLDSVYNRMTTKERLGQLLVVAAGYHGRKATEVVELAEEKKIGGVIWLGGTASEFAEMKVQFDSVSKSIGLLYAIDAEPSLMHYKLKNIESFIKTKDIESKEDCDSVTAMIDSHLMDLGVHINYAPVADLTPENEVIGHRSFGKDSQRVREMCLTFIDQSLEDEIYPVIKHFPGHGNVVGDSHKKLVYIDGEMKELPVFERLVKAGAPMVMVGHIAVKNNAYSSELPATCNRELVTELLRDSLAFNGLIITDALNMGAVTQLENPGFLALKAGCDQILMPRDVDAVLRDAMDLIKEDEQFALQVELSVKRTLALKHQLGLLNL